MTSYKRIVKGVMQLVGVPLIAAAVVYPEVVRSGLGGLVKSILLISAGCAIGWLIHKALSRN